jgi:hypothetical protein
MSNYDAVFVRRTLGLGRPQLEIPRHDNCP